MGGWIGPGRTTQGGVLGPGRAWVLANIFEKMAFDNPILGRGPPVWVPCQAGWVGSPPPPRVLNRTLFVDKQGSFPTEQNRVRPFRTVGTAWGGGGDLTPSGCKWVRADLGDIGTPEECNCVASLKPEECGIWGMCQL